MGRGLDTWRSFLASPLDPRWELRPADRVPTEISTGLVTEPVEVRSTAPASIEWVAVSIRGARSSRHHSTHGGSCAPLIECRPRSRQAWLLSLSKCDQRRQRQSNGSRSRYVALVPRVTTRPTV